MSANIKKWRDAATLILVAKQTLSTTEKVNYKILTLKRSSKSSFMPDTQVFPGGTLDKADCSSDWLQLYKKFGIHDQHFDIFKRVKYVAPIFRDSNTIPKFISLRICAIREAFEECGVLLCRSVKQGNDGGGALWASYFDELDVNKWQKRVHNDPNSFIELCDTFQVYPDIWALNEWSCWLTPASFQKRFDTIFFITNIQKNIATLAEQKEVQSIQWDYPEVLIKNNQESKIFLPPPQFYELHRLTNFSTIEELAEFSKNRALNGTEQFLPYTLATEKISVTLLPGDDLYPEDKKELPNNEIMEEIPEKEVVHRLNHSNTYKHSLRMKNIKYKINHVYPVLEKSKF